MSGSDSRGLYCVANSKPVIVNTVIYDCDSQGIYSGSDSNLLTIRGSSIEDCYNGIVSASKLEVTNSIIRNIDNRGVDCSGSGKVRKIKNSLIYDCPTNIYCSTTSAAGSEITGCTLFCSTKCLTFASGSPDTNMQVRNSILWGIPSSDAWRPCTRTDYNIDYCRVIKGYSGGGHNTSGDPCFVNLDYAYPEKSDLHIKSDSNCIDSGSSYTPTEGEADIDMQPRKWGIKVDLGADEDANDADLDNSGGVNFVDYAIFANAWQMTSSSLNWNADCNIAPNSWGIDYRDLDIFLNWWLWEAAAYKMDSESLMGDGMMMEQGQQEFSMELAEEFIGGEQMLMGIDYNFPAIYLTCDTNTPDVNDEVTVYVKSDWPLFAMEAAIYINGDADIIDAMDSNEAPDFGWDPGWYFPELIDDGWVSIGGVSWVSDANGTVGYVKLRYNSGQVSVYFDQDLSNAYTWTDANDAMLPFSQQALLIGRDPNE